MKRFVVAGLLTAALMVSMASLGQAGSEVPAADAYPVVAQLALRDRTITITSAPAGYRYTIADEAGEILSASLTEEQLAEQYPELVESLRPAIAGEPSELMMLAPEL
jgi:5,10-methenyltetrahydromethanopterin hydrogenase